MNRISEAFKNGKAFISFITAGDPDLDKTADFIKILSESGSDLIELGIPFSDPVAEGPVIERADMRALAKGTDPDKIFDMVEKVRKDVKTPILLLTYLNPVFNYGYEKFFKRCSSSGIDGVIIPDIPYEEQDEFLEYSKKYGITSISLIAPSSEGRIAMIAKRAEGFVYCVSSYGVTGIRSNITTDLKTIVNIIRGNTDAPIAIGFGIGTPQQAEEMAGYADGVIVGSAIVQLIEEHGANAGKYIADYVKSMKQAVLKAGK